MEEPPAGPPADESEWEGPVPTPCSDWCYRLSRGRDKPPILFHNWHDENPRPDAIRVWRILQGTYQLGW